MQEETREAYALGRMPGRAGFDIYPFSIYVFF